MKKLTKLPLMTFVLMFSGTMLFENSKCWGGISSGRVQPILLPTHTNPQQGANVVYSYYGFQNGQTIAQQPQVEEQTKSGLANNTKLQKTSDIDGLLKFKLGEKKQIQVVKQEIEGLLSVYRLKLKFDVEKKDELNLENKISSTLKKYKKENFYINPVIHHASQTEKFFKNAIKYTGLNLMKSKLSPVATLGNKVQHQIMIEVTDQSQNHIGYVLIDFTMHRIGTKQKRALTISFTLYTKKGQKLPYRVYEANNEDKSQIAFGNTSSIKRLNGVQYGTKLYNPKYLDLAGLNNVQVGSAIFRALNKITNSNLVYFYYNKKDDSTHSIGFYVQKNALKGFAEFWKKFDKFRVVKLNEGAEADGVNIDTSKKALVSIKHADRYSPWTAKQGDKVTVSKRSRGGEMVAYYLTIDDATYTKYIKPYVTKKETTEKKKGFSLFRKKNKQQI